MRNIMTQFLYRLLNSKWFWFISAMLGFIASFGILIVINSLFPLVSSFATLASPYLTSSLTTVVGMVFGSRISNSRPTLVIGALGGAAIGSFPVYLGLAALPPVIGLLGTGIILATFGAAGFILLGLQLPRLFKNRVIPQQQNNLDVTSENLTYNVSPSNQYTFLSSQLIATSLPLEKSTLRSGTARLTSVPASDATNTEDSAYPFEIRRQSIVEINNLVIALEALLRNNTAVNQWKQFYATNAESAYIKKFTSTHWFVVLHNKINNGDFDKTPRANELFNQISHLIIEHNKKIDSSTTFFTKLTFEISRDSERVAREIDEEQELRRAKILEAGGALPARFRNKGFN
jgi:hypothetical protein